MEDVTKPHGRESKRTNQFLFAWAGEGNTFYTKSIEREFNQHQGFFELAYSYLLQRGYRSHQ